jgi:SurA N-terminal domain
MSRSPWTVTAAAVLCVTAVAPAAAQAPPLPEGVVARVGEQPITEREFRHWLRINVRGESPGSAPLDPPRFKRCVAAELRMLRKGAPRPSRRALRLRCRTRYDALRTSTTLFLIHTVWTRQEAAARGIAVTPEQVRREFERQKRQAFPTERTFRRFLRATGMTEADLLERVELEMLQEGLSDAAVEGVPKVTEEDVDRYYARHRRRYRGIAPARARREIRVLLTARRQQRAISLFVADFRSRYRAITVCADGHVISECSNAPGP